MALRTPLSVTPHLYMGDSTGRPLDKGVVYFGEQDKDPEFYPINLFSDDALTKPLMQPVHTKGGYLYDKGDMVEPHAKEIIYSVKVLDSYGRKVFYKGAMMRNSWNDDVIDRIGEGLIAAGNKAQAAFDAAAAKVTANAAQAVEAAIDGVAIDANLINDALVVTVPTFGAVDAIPRTQASKNRERISVKDFGAKGDGDQTVVTVPAYMAGRDKGWSITEQTADGDAFNKAIRYLRSIGGGALHVPTGEYRIYSYLENIDFPLVIYGDGESSLLINCDASPTDKSGYGILCVQPRDDAYEVGLLNFKLDGVADIRPRPTSELQIYPLVVYGAPRLRAYGITSINSPIDCLNVNFDNIVLERGLDCFAKFVSCYFDNCYRNSITVGKGDNIEFVNVTASRGGYVHGGTNPRYCVDIEPNSPSTTVKTKWVNCTFSHGHNVLVGGVWSDSVFSNCVFDGSFVAPVNTDRHKFPWLFQFTAGQWEIDNCKFIGRSDAMRNECHHYNAYGTGYNFTDDSYLRIKNSTWIHSGVISAGRSISIENCYAQLSMCPFLFQGGTAAPTHDVVVKNLRLSNVFDGNNLGSGAGASFTVATSIKGVVDIDGLTAEVDSRTLPEMPKDLFTQVQYRGIHLPTLSNSGYRRTAKNVHSEGYYKRIIAYLGLPENATYFRDWGTPNSAPSDTQTVNSSVAASVTNGEVTGTVVDGVLTDAKLTNKAVTGTATQTASGAVSIGSVSGYYFRGCTMWGNFN